MSSNLTKKLSKSGQGLIRSVFCPEGAASGGWGKTADDAVCSSGELFGKTDPLPQGAGAEGAPL